MHGMMPQGKEKPDFFLTTPAPDVTLMFAFAGTMGL
jgi:hypothetical protein